MYMSKDVWALNSDEIDRYKEQAKGRNKGVLCEKKNSGRSGKCQYCEEAQKLFSTGLAEDNALARRKLAKANFYANIVKSDDPSKEILLEIGKKAGNDILDMLKEDCKDAINPLKNKGRELKIKKIKDGDFNAYKVTPVMERADWGISENVLENLTDLGDIANIVMNDTKPIFRISSLNEGDTLVFRLCPYWHWKEKGQQVPLTWLWRHWDTTPIGFDTDKPKDDNTVPWGGNGSTSKSTELPECFGKDEYYDKDDEVNCQKCNHLKECGDKVSS